MVCIEKTCTFTFVRSTVGSDITLLIFKDNQTIGKPFMAKDIKFYIPFKSLYIIYQLLYLINTTELSSFPKINI